MRVITEAELRDQYKQAEFTSYRLPAGTGLTPSAQQFLSERRIKVLNGATDGLDMEPKTRPDARENGEAYSVLETGQKLDEKPEHLTHIHGRILVAKNHPRIKFRGKLDHLQALLISAIIDIEGFGYRELTRDLGEMLEYCRQIMSAEVTGAPLAPLTFRGLSNLEIREHSHHPRRHYDVSHIFIQPGHGRVMAQLNLLRTETRELELAAMDAFHGQPEGIERPEGMERPDILQSLNRLSSLVYVFMLQLVSGSYKVGS
ncbi:MAG: hypothetical protein CVU89_07475 [Firmicutes bacterium HGW-Firmicutes-14]|nr:MAG: hypothetical protein CVU89_07475 [Firmicutes bacterium HGW-Firmicutes-14]